MKKIIATLVVAVLATGILTKVNALVPETMAAQESKYYNPAILRIYFTNMRKERDILNAYAQHVDIDLTVEADMVQRILDVTATGFTASGGHGEDYFSFYYKDIKEEERGKLNRSNNKIVVNGIGNTLIQDRRVENEVYLQKTLNYIDELNYNVTVKFGDVVNATNINASKPNENGPIIYKNIVNGVTNYSFENVDSEMGIYLEQLVASMDYETINQLLG